MLDLAFILILIVGLIAFVIPQSIPEISYSNESTDSMSKQE